MRRKILANCKCLLLLVLAIGTALLRSPSVYAADDTLKSRTIGEIIVTILASAGTAVTNTDVINQIYTNYDTDTYSIESLIDNGILYVNGMSAQQAKEQLGTNTEFEIDTAQFRTLINTNWQFMRKNGMDAVFKINNVANTDTTYGAIDNIGMIVKNIAKKGYIVGEELFEIVKDGLGAYKVSIEEFARAVINVFQQNIMIGQDITYPAPDLGYCAWYKAVHPQTGSVAYTYLFSRYKHTSYWAAYGTLGYQIQDLRLGLIGLSDNTDQILVWTYIDGVQRYTGAAGTSNLPVNFNGLRGDANTYIVVDCIKPLLATKADAENNLYDQRDGTYEPRIISPDIINQDYGNIAYGDDIVPPVEDGQAIYIIPHDAYQDFVDDINDNDNPEYNGDTMTIFVYHYIVPIPTPTPTIVPPQPSLTPKPPITEEEQDTSLGGTTKGLENIFPFCIPFDIKRIFSKLETTRQAPHIVYNMEYQGNSLGTIDIDLATYDTVAGILRTLEVILYMFGLAIATRQLIGA